MRIHYLQHVIFEGPGTIAEYARSRGHILTNTRLFADEPLPELAGIDLLVVLGGAMNIYEEDKYGWLTGEKQFIRAAIAEGKAVLGICLGAQLIADVLGARVYPGDFPEIGWFPVTLTAAARQSGFFASIPESLPVFHWHGDTFAIPSGAVRLARSLACENQAFVFGDRVLALQFHLESTPDSIRALIENCAHEIVEGTFVQNAEEMLSPPADRFDFIHQVMFGLLDQLLGKVE